jgi:hypothetical protein
VSPKAVDLAALLELKAAAFVGVHSAGMLHLIASDTTVKADNVCPLFERPDHGSPRLATRVVCARAVVLGALRALCVAKGRRRVRRGRIHVPRRGLAAAG